MKNRRQPGGPHGSRPNIGISACFFHADPARPIFTGKTLQYVEQSIVHWVQSSGAVAFLIPSPEGPTRRGDVSLEHYADLLDGLVLEGGSDMWPGSYGETALRPEWNGDRVRDEYEIALLRAFVDRGKPVLGICRGLQVLNVAFGGTLYQDIATQRPDSLKHRDAALYDRNFHTIDLAPGTRLAQLYPGVRSAVVNSVHHQGIRDLAPCMQVEARCPNDGIVEAIRLDPARAAVKSYVAAVQWHPEFHERRPTAAETQGSLAARAAAPDLSTDARARLAELPDVLDDDPILADFLAACRLGGTQRAPRVDERGG